MVTINRGYVVNLQHAYTKACCKSAHAAISCQEVAHSFRFRLCIEQVDRLIKKDLVFLKSFTRVQCGVVIMLMNKSLGPEALLYCIW